MEAPTKDLKITRTLDAPREMVFRAWTQENLLSEWWGPNGFEVPVCEIDLRPGGKMRIEMIAPDGTFYPMGGLFRVIDPPGHLLFTSGAFEDENGDYDFEMNNTITFEETDGKTAMLLHVEVVKSPAEMQNPIEGMEQGWSQSFDKLEALLNRK